MTQEDAAGYRAKVVNCLREKGYTRDEAWQLVEIHATSIARGIVGKLSVSEVTDDIISRQEHRKAVAESVRRSFEAND